MTDEEPVEETEVEEEVDEVVERPQGKGYKCVNCETEVEIDPVDDKIICPKCSHRVLLKKRSEDPDTVKAI
ncbi:MAG: hypothetical protein H8Z69_00830 [Nanohaloarchaea archaeon]|nr:hypothetical protein [Candidatus Nanohaloarchaea archaeon]